MITCLWLRRSATSITYLLCSLDVSDVLCRNMNILLLRGLCTCKDLNFNFSLLLSNREHNIHSHEFKLVVQERIMNFNFVKGQVLAIFNWSIDRSLRYMYMYMGFQEVSNELPSTSAPSSPSCLLPSTSSGFRPNFARSLLQIRTHFSDLKAYM